METKKKLSATIIENLGTGSLFIIHWASWKRKVIKVYENTGGLDSMDFMEMRGMLLLPAL